MRSQVQIYVAAMDVGPSAGVAASDSQGKEASANPSGSREAAPLASDLAAAYYGSKQAAESAKSAARVQVTAKLFQVHPDILLAGYLITNLKSFNFRLSLLAIACRLALPRVVASGQHSGSLGTD